MTHRLDIRKAPGVVTFHFHGLLDVAALEELRAVVSFAAASGARVVLVLREGTEVERVAVAGLRTLSAEIVAEPAYLARWIKDAP